MQIKNEESRSGGLDGEAATADRHLTTAYANGVAVASSGVDGGADEGATPGSGSIGTGDLGNGGGGGVDEGQAKQEKEFVKEKQLKKPSFVVGASRAWQDVGKF